SALSRHLCSSEVRCASPGLRPSLEPSPYPLPHGGRGELGRPCTAGGGKWDGLARLVREIGTALHGGRGKLERPCTAGEGNLGKGPGGYASITVLTSIRVAVASATLEWSWRFSTNAVTYT